MSVPTISEPTAAPEFNLQQHLATIRRRKSVFIQVFAMVLAVCIVAVAMMKPVYETTAKLLVTAGSSSVSVVDSNNPISTMLAAAQPDSVDTQLQVLQSQPFLDEAFRQAHVVKKDGEAPPTVRAQVVEGTNVIEVTVDGGDPQEITKLANTVVRLHLERSDLLTTTGLRDTLEFVKKEKEKADSKLAAAEKKLVQFRQAHRLVGLTSEKDAQAGEYAALLARVLEAQSDIRSATQQIGTLRDQLAREPRQRVAVDIRDNPVVAKLQEKLDELRFQRTDLLRDYQPESRAVADLDREIATFQKQLNAEPRYIQVKTYSDNPARPLLQTRLQELQSARQSDTQVENAAAAQLQAKKELIDSLGPWESQLSQLTSDRDAARGAAVMLADHLRDLNIRAEARLRTARPIEWAAAPRSPIRPRRSNSIFLSIILALALATGTVFLQEYVDDRVNAPDDVERLVPLRALAHVPSMAANQPHLVADLPMNAPAVEAYRALRSSVAFAGFDQPIHRLQITSAAKGEGKTTTAVNLATAMARDGKSVILVDADLRAPSVHRLLGLPELPGLSETLAGMAPLEEALVATEIENLLVLPAGAIPPNPAELLGSGLFEQTLQQLGERADIIIVDTPPCLPVTDPVIVSARMDAVALVVQFGATRKAGLKHTVELLAQARARIAGVVFNQVHGHGAGYYYYHSYSAYGYGGTNGNGHRNGGGLSGSHRNRQAVVADHRRANSSGGHWASGDDDEA